MAKKLTYTRYIWFIDQARRGRHPSTTKLMKQFEISLAQAQRDIEYIRLFLAAPLKYVAAEKGYELEDNAFCLPSVWIEDDELLLLAVAKELIHDPDSKRILADLFRKIASNSRIDLGTVSQAISYKGMGQYKQRPGILSPLLDAIINQRQAELLYRDVFGPVCEATWRKVTPLHLLFYRANWYLLAIYNEEWRTFSLARLEAVKTLPDLVKRISQKAIHERISAAFGIFITDQKHSVLTVKLRFIPQMARFVRSVMLHPGQEFCDRPDGCLDVSFPSTINRELIGEILGFGEQVEVLEPEELKSQIREIVNKTAAIYK